MPMAQPDPLTFLQAITIFAGLAFLLHVLLQKLNFDVISKVLYSLAFVITFIQFSATTPFEFTNDIKGHIQYIEYIAASWTLPPPAGWQTQQPPLYYVIAAATYNLASALELSLIYMVRVLSVIFYFGAMIFGGLIMRRLIAHKLTLYLCLATMLLWPAAAHTSVKITNDIPVIFFSAGFVYFLISWIADNAPSRLLLTILFVAGGIATKSSSLLLLGVLGCVLLFRLWKKEITLDTLRQPLICLGWGAIILCLALNFGRIYVYKVQNPEVRWLINRDESYIGTWEHVDNKPKNYLQFKAELFVTKPFMRLNKVYPEGHYFFNVLFKTLLFGDMQYPRGHSYAQSISFLFLAMLTWLLVMKIHLRHAPPAADLRLIHVLVFTTLCAVIMVMCARISVPVLTQANGRYIYVCIILMLALYGRALGGMYQLKRHSWTAYGASLTLAFMTIRSLCFTVSQWEVFVPFRSFVLE